MERWVRERRGLSMKIPGVSRVARFDFLRVAGVLATKIAKWASKCGCQLARLAGHVNAAAGLTH
eukprot:5547228-Alexandrium_andersonii.AAC.1